MPLNDRLLSSCRAIDEDVYNRKFEMRDVGVRACCGHEAARPPRADHNSGSCASCVPDACDGGCHSAQRTDTSTRPREQRKTLTNTLTICAGLVRPRH